MQLTSSQTVYVDWPNYPDQLVWDLRISPYPSLTLRYVRVHICAFVKAFTCDAIVFVPALVRACIYFVNICEEVSLITSACAPFLPRIVYQEPKCSIVMRVDSELIPSIYLFCSGTPSLSIWTRLCPTSPNSPDCSTASSLPPTLTNDIGRYAYIGLIECGVLFHGRMRICVLMRRMYAAGTGGEDH